MSEMVKIIGIKPRTEYIIMTDFYRSFERKIEHCTCGCCGVRLNKTQRYCSQCGNKIDWEDK